MPGMKDRVRRALRVTLLTGSMLGAALTASPAIAAAAEATPKQAPRPARPPNIVFILADDLGVEGINSYGGEYYTPNIDALARQGVSFDSAHAMPNCTPTRTRLLTARENHRNYEAFGFLNAKERTFGTAMKEAGYVTGIVGKWQLSGNGFDGRIGITPTQAGFDEYLLWQVNGVKGSRYWGPTQVENGRTKTSEAGFGPNRERDFALDFIERHKDRPFVLYIPTVLPHAPFVPTPNSPNASEPKERFAGMISYLDTMVGQVTAKLSELGLDDNTVVIFSSDNGTNKKITSYRNGAEVSGGKGTSTIRGTHVPMIVRWTGHFPAGARRDGLFDIMDVYPTMAEIAGRPVPTGSIDGVSQVPVIAGEKRSARDHIFMHYAPVWPTAEPARFVFDSSFKLYGDGTFVKLDIAHGGETEVKSPKAGSPAARRLAEFRRILATANDGPLDQDRFPMCIGKPSLEPERPAVRAGCAGMRDMAESE